MTRHALRPCLDCGDLHRNQHARCSRCQSKRDQRRNQIRTQYQGEWQSLSKAARATATHCNRCGVLLVQSNTDPRGSTFDHETLTVECRRCNSSHRRNVS